MIHKKTVCACIMSYNVDECAAYARRVINHCHKEGEKKSAPTTSTPGLKFKWLTDLFERNLLQARHSAKLMNR